MTAIMLQGLTRYGMSTCFRILPVIICLYLSPAGRLTRRLFIYKKSLSTVEPERPETNHYNKSICQRRSYKEQFKKNDRSNVCQT